MTGGMPAAGRSSPALSTSGGTSSARQRLLPPVWRAPRRGRAGCGWWTTRSAASGASITGSMLMAGGCSIWCGATRARSGCTGCHRGSTSIGHVRLRWTGHQLRAECEVIVETDWTAVQAHEAAVEAEHRLLHAMPGLVAALVHADPQPSGGTDHHSVLASHR